MGRHLELHMLFRLSVQQSQYQTSVSQEIRAVLFESAKDLGEPEKMMSMAMDWLILSQKRQFFTPTTLSSKHKTHWNVNLQSSHKSTVN